MTELFVRYFLIQIGELVEIDILRGHPLPFDPSDPNVKKVGDLTIVQANGPENLTVSGIRAASSNQSIASSNASSQGPPKLRRQDDVSASEAEDRNRHVYDPRSYQSQSRFERQDSVGRSSISSVPSQSSQMAGPPRYARVGIVKGGNGFGFTIADSPYGQRVKEIIDAGRCRGLQQGDLIVEINSKVVRNVDHTEIVNTLKSCPRNEEAEFVVQRGGTTYISTCSLAFMLSLFHVCHIHYCQT